MGRGPQQLLVFRRWGGKRKGAGRKPRGARSSEPHRRRPGLSKRHPVHVTLRVTADVGRLRRPHAYLAARKALICSRRRPDFRICHLSIQGNHLHLVAEADDERALARGMQGFEISCAKHLNAALRDHLGQRRRGTVFPDRYHARQLRTPRQVRAALAYVLCNWRRHGEDRGSNRRFDPFSTAPNFDGWIGAPPRIRIAPPHHLLPVSTPRSWMLTTGWRRHGRIDPLARPGPR